MAGGTPEHAGDERGLLALAVALAALAGWVDATSFIHFRHLFVSFMSGNSTQGAVAAAGGDLARLLVFARTVALFVGGVAVAELVSAPAGRWGRLVVLALEGGVLAGAAAAAWRGGDELAVSSCLALAMGMQNAAVHKAGGISIGLTYVTGTLVQVGRRLAAALRGDGPWHGPVPFLALWTGLVCGGFGGALAAGRSLVLALGVAAAYCGLLSAAVLVATALRRAGPRADRAGGRAI